MSPKEYHVKIVVLGNTWVVLVLLIAWIAIQENSKITRDQRNAQHVRKGNIKWILEVHLVLIVKLGNTWVITLVLSTV